MRGTREKIRMLFFLSMEEAGLCFSLLRWVGKMDFFDCIVDSWGRQDVVRVAACLRVAGLAERVAQPFQALVQAVAGGGAGGLDVLYYRVST